MRISDWSSDVCSSDLDQFGPAMDREGRDVDEMPDSRLDRACSKLHRQFHIGVMQRLDRKSVVSGKSVSVRVDLGGRRIIKKKNKSKSARTNITNTTTHSTI